MAAMTKAFIVGWRWKGGMFVRGTKLCVVFSIVPGERCAVRSPLTGAADREQQDEAVLASGRGLCGMRWG